MNTTFGRAACARPTRARPAPDKASEPAAVAWTNRRRVRALPLAAIYSSLRMSARLEHFRLMRPRGCRKRQCALQQRCKTKPASGCRSMGTGACLPAGATTTTTEEMNAQDRAGDRRQSGDPDDGITCCQPGRGAPAGRADRVVGRDCRHLDHGGRCLCVPPPVAPPPPLLVDWLLWRLVRAGVLLVPTALLRLVSRLVWAGLGLGLALASQVVVVSTWN